MDTYNENWQLIPCVETTRPKNKQGYGVLNKSHYGCSFEHRLVYSDYHKIKLTPKQFVCHKCDNPGCIEITHLFLGTAQDNSTDMVNKGRSARGEKNSRAKLTEIQVKEIRKKYRSREYTVKELALMYKVSTHAIHCAFHKKTWGHVS